jgi:hypothetical protein
MCIDSVGHLVMQDETVQKLMANPILDLVHKQVIMTLYSLDSLGRMDDHKSMLPVYLGQDWSKCSSILDTLVEAGLLARSGERISLTHPIQSSGEHHSCGCQ